MPVAHVFDGDDWIELLPAGLTEEQEAAIDLIRHGTGAPNGVVSAPVGSIYLRTDGGTSTTLYVKETGTGNTGWVAK